MKTARKTFALKSIVFKLRVLFLPFLYIAVGLLIVYTFFNWWLFISTGSTSVREDVLNLWLPIALAGVAVLVWLRSRIKLLKLKTGKGDLPTLYVFVAVAAIAVPTIIAQSYITTATGKLTDLETVRKANRWQTTKYYTVHNYFVDKGHASVHIKADVSGKRNENLNFRLSFASPLYDARDVIPLKDLGPFFSATYKPTVFFDGEVIDSAQVTHLKMDSVSSIYMLGLRAARIVYGRDAWNGAIFIEKMPRDVDDYKAPSEINKFSPRMWVGVTYRKTVSNRLSDEEKFAAYQLFANSSLQQFKERDLQGFTYLDRIGNTEERQGYLSAIEASNYYDDANPIIVEPVWEPFSERNGKKGGWVFGSLAIGAAVWLLMILLPGLHTRNPKAVQRNKVRDWRDLKEMLPLAVPREGYFVTPIILYLNSAVFLLMVAGGLGFVSFDAEDLLRWGGNFRPFTLSGDWWRLLTSMFLHGGVLHLAMNMVGLLFVSVFLEPLLGRGRYAMAYLLTGLVGSAASVWWHPAVVSVGASGAIFGLYGTFLALLLTRVFPPEMNKSFLLSTSLFVGYNLLMGLTGGIDNAAHIGGLLSGLLVGFCLYSFLDKKEELPEATFSFEKEEAASLEER